MSEIMSLSPRGVVAAAYRAALAGDVDAFARSFVDDAVLEFPFSREPSVPVRVEGREDIRRVALALGDRFRRSGRRVDHFEDLFVHQTTDPEVLVVEFESRDEPASGDASYRLPEIQVWRVRDGKVVTMRDYLGSRDRGKVRPLEIRAHGGSTWG